MTELSLVAPGPSLSASLRQRIRAAHARAEASPFLVALAAGALSRTGLAALLSRLAPVYRALEAAEQVWREDPLIAAFLLPGLARSSRIQADLQVLTGGAQEARSTAATAYAEQVTVNGGRCRVAFLAHHYTRYLGDLSGGQVLRDAVARSLGVGDGTGGSFFSFPELHPDAARSLYGQRLDDAVLSEGERAQLIEQVLVAFGLHAALLGELDAGVHRWSR